MCTRHGVCAYYQRAGQGNARGHGMKQRSTPHNQALLVNTLHCTRCLQRDKLHETEKTAARLEQLLKAERAQTAQLSAAVSQREGGGGAGKRRSSMAGTPVHMGLLLDLCRHRSLPLPACIICGPLCRAMSCAHTQSAATSLHILLLPCHAGEAQMLQMLGNMDVLSAQYDAISDGVVHLDREVATGGSRRQGHNDNAPRHRVATRMTRGMPR